MALPNLGIGGVEDQINNAVTSTNGTAAMASGIRDALMAWLSGNIFPIIMSALIFITVVFVFYGSFQYFTAYGNDAKAENAKKTITFAIVGFLIAVLAFSISTYVQRIIIDKNYETRNNSAAPVEQNIDDSTNNSNPFDI